MFLKKENAETTILIKKLYPTMKTCSNAKSFCSNSRNFGAVSSNNHETYRTLIAIIFAQYLNKTDVKLMIADMKSCC